MTDAAESNSLSLPPGVGRDQLRRAVVASGYPLQNVVADDLIEGFQVVEEWGYVDRISGEHRALDLFAHRVLQQSSTRLHPSLTLLIECKRSEMPYVVFASVVPRIPPEFPPIVGLPSKTFELHHGKAYREISPSEFLRCSDLAFVRNGPAVASAFTRAERRGKDHLELSGTMPYKNIVLPLASALDHYRDMRGSVRDQPKYFPSFPLCVSVVDAQIVVADGVPESPQLRNESWVRIVRQEAVQDRHSWRRHHYVVDLVERKYFRQFLSDHVVPFAEEVASRMVVKEACMAVGKGRVADIEEWQWSDLRPV